MKKIQKLCFLALVGLMVGTSCEKTPATTPNPETECVEGVVIRWDCPSLLTVQVTNGVNIGAVYTNSTGTQTYSNALTITNTQLADSLGVTYARGEKIYFSVNKNETNPYSKTKSYPCMLNMPLSTSTKAYSITTISNKSCN